MSSSLKNHWQVNFLQSKPKRCVHLCGNTQDEGWHDWSPDGKWLAIELFTNNQDQFHIGLMNWETKEMKILTDTTHQYQQSPVFVLNK